MFQNFIDLRWIGMHESEKTLYRLGTDYICRLSRSGLGNSEPFSGGGFILLIIRISPGD